MPTTEERVEQHLAIVTDEARGLVARALAVGATPASLADAVTAVYAYEEQTKAALVQALARDPKCLPVCAAGCAFCCHLSVFASVPELLVLAAHLRATLTDAELAARTEATVAAAAAVRELGQKERAAARRPCPLLGGLDGATRQCGVYAARPLACRAYNSCDAGVCEKAFDDAATHWDLPTDLFQLTVSRNARKGLISAVFAAGLDPGPYELAPGLAVALTIPDAARRWLAGERIFDAAETRIGRERRAGWRASHAGA